MEKLRRTYPDISPSGPNYARAVRAGNQLFISGCTAMKTPAEGGPAIEQLKVVLDKLVRIVAAEGGTPTDIVKITTFVTDIGDWWPLPDEQLALYNEYFGDQHPANSLVEVSALAEPGLNLEIEAIAVIG